MADDLRRGLVGERFGRLLVIGSAGSHNGKLLWRCSCDCGGRTVAPTGNLRSGNTKSCGCLRKDTKAALSHGFSGHPLYRIWLDMLRRCLSPTCRTYPAYGGRGITVCEQWRRDFTQFVADMGERPDGMTLERIDVNGDYEPGNCRWATRSDQQRNKRNNRLITFRGQSLTIAGWAELTGLSHTTIEGRIRLGWPVERALTEPYHRRRTGQPPINRTH